MPPGGNGPLSVIIGVSSMRRPPPHLPHLPPNVERTYKDLDDPTDDGRDKNPWGSLAKSWGKKETASVDFQELLHQHVSSGMILEIASFHQFMMNYLGLM